MTGKIANFIKIIFSILFIIVISLFIIEYSLSYFNYPFQVSSNSKLYPIECKKKNDDILSSDTEINNLYHDGGFRNYEYANNKEGFLKVILDTQCLNTQSIYDNDKMIRLTPFINETYKFNKYGFRGNSWIDSNNINDINVFIMGGSTAFSLLATEEDSIHYQLEKILNAKNTQNTYRVFNAALPGAKSSHEFRIFSSDLKNVKKDIIIFLTGYNNAGNYQIDTFERSKRPFLSNKSIEFITSALEKINLKKISIVFKNANFPLTHTNENTLDSLISYSVKSKKQCEYLQIRCIFILQPTLLVQRKSLTHSEKKIKDSHFNTRIKKISTDFEKSYNLFDAHFTKNNFEYYNLTNLGNNSMYNNFIEKNQKVTLNRISDIKKLIFSKYDTLTTEPLKIEVNGSQFYYKDKCNKKKLEFRLDENSFNYFCFIDQLEELRNILQFPEKYKINVESVNKPILYSPQEDYFIFNFGSYKKVNEVNLLLTVSNEDNYDDIKIKVSLSDNGENFSEIKELTKTFSESNFSFNWKLKRTDFDNLVLKVDFPNSQFIGINDISYIIKGNNEIFSDGEKYYKISNKGNHRIFLETMPNQNKQIFIDSAHLSDIANKEIARELANIIINK
tara:strand:- start:6474 stop:8330 length:1857 start_codon:yes stop_codon:yes gene_type:complete